MIRGSIILVLIIALSSACSEVIDLNTNGKESLISIYGHFNNGTLGNQVTIELTSDIQLPPKPISGASVSVFDSEGNAISYVENINQKGEYLKENVEQVGQIGEAYYLEVVLPNGNIYRSDFESVPSKGAIDLIDFEVSTIEKEGQGAITYEEYSVSLFAETQLTSERRDLYLKWDIESTWFFPETSLPGQFWWWMPDVCYMTDHLEGQEVRLFSTADILTDKISRRLMVTDRIDETFYGKQYYSLIQSTINADAHRFWSSINQIANIQGGIFDPVLGQVPSNLYNVDDPSEFVLGFFEVAHVDTTHVEITRDDVDLFYNEPCVIPLEILNYPPGAFGRLSAFFPEPCLDCTTLPNSSLKKPYFWND